MGGALIFDGTGLQTVYRGGMYVGKYMLGYKPNIDNIKIYDSLNRLVKEEQYQYTKTASETFNGLKVIQRISSDEKSLLDHANKSVLYTCLSSFFDYMNYSIETGKEILASKKIMTYDGGISTDSESYTYNSKYQLIKITKSNSVLGVLSKEYTYPTPGSELEKKNMLSTVIKTTTSHNNREIGIIETVYPNNSILPGYVRSSTGNNVFRTDVTFDQYDKHGNLRQFTALDGSSTTILWGYNNFHPIMEIKNAKYSEITPIISDATLVALSDKSSLSASDSSLINNLRTNSNLQNTLISTYIYKPLVGITSVIDPAGLRTLYSYDLFGHLKDIKDSNNKLIASYNHNYNIYLHGEEEGLFIKHSSLHGLNYENKSLYTPNSSATFELVSPDKKTYTYSWSLFSLDTFSNIPITTSTGKSVSISLTRSGNMRLSCVSEDLGTGNKIESITYFEVATLPLKLEIPIKNQYYENSYYDFYINVQGGSGNYTYNWSLQDEFGNSIVSNTMEKPNILIPSNKRGKLTVSCTVKDIVTGQSLQSSKIINVAYKPISISISNQNSYGINKSFLLQANVNGGSGRFNYSWTVTDNNGRILASSTNPKPSFTRPEAGPKNLTCFVEDLETGETQSLAKEIKIKHLIEIKNMQTTFVADTKTLTFEIYSPKGVSLETVTFQLLPYFSNKRAQGSYSFNNLTATYLDNMSTKAIKNMSISQGTTFVKMTLYSEGKSRASFNMILVQPNENFYPDIMLEQAGVSLIIE
jgi:hypothetical protein